MPTAPGHRAAVAIPLKLAPASPSTVTSHEDPTAVTDARWVQVVRYAALAVFGGLIAFSALQPHLAGRVVWTVAIASLPLFFVLGGYHRWRRICPLAFIAQVPTFVGRAGQKRAGRWLQAHGYRLPFYVFLISLWLRLVATNGDGYAIAVFLAAISLAAFATGLIFTGKTWCNYVCPVSFVEKLYTEPRGLRETPNSQCRKCTACRPACPDINQENTYWKELLLGDKRYVFFAFPGVVLAFYVYYYVQAGSWDYYFSGRWTHEVGLVRSAFLPGSQASTAGAYFWPEVPRAAAAAVTLLLGAALSLALFSLIEQRAGAFVRRREGGINEPAARHITFSLAAFSAFVTFYSFAGAPTLRLIAGVPQVFQLVMVTTGTIFLVRRISRRQRDFAEETLARKIIGKWPWSHTPPPRDLQEAFRIHTVLSQSAQNAPVDMIGRYKSAVRESINSGVLSRADVHRLDSLRTKLRITDAEHERVMAELVDEEGDLIIGGKPYASPEKQLQLKTYAEALTARLEQRAATAAPSDDEVIRRLRDEYRVTMDEHRAVLDHLVRSREGIAAHVLDTPAAIEVAATSIRDLGPVRSSVSRFLSALLRRRWIRSVEGLLEAVADADERTPAYREGLLDPDPQRRRATLVDLASRFSPPTAARLIDACDRARHAGVHPDTPTTLRLQLASPDPYIRATAIYMLESAGASSEADRQLLANDEHPLVRETLAQARIVASGGTMAEPSTLEKMIALRSIGIFETVEPEDLLRLARASTEAWFSQGDVLCREGEMGDEVFVLLAGDVSVLQHHGDDARIVAGEGAGTCIGELSVLDSAPREATVIASSIAVRALRLNGRSFREATSTSPAMAESIIRLLARRLRAANAVPAPAPDPDPTRAGSPRPHGSPPAI